MMEHSSSINVALKPDAATGVVSQRLFLALFEQIESNEDGVRRDADIEYLHDFRVTVRRTRALLRHMRPVLPRDVLNAIRDEFAWLGGITGPLRDLDIQIVRFPEFLQHIPEVNRQHLQPLCDILKKHRESERFLLLDALNSQRYQRLKQEWRDYLQGNNMAVWQSSTGGRRPAIVTARALIWRQHGKVIKTGAELQVDSPDRRFHKLRKECKRLRYLLELFASLFSVSDINSMIKTLKRLQDNLGEYQDACVQVHTLAGYSDELKTYENGKQALPAIEKLIKQFELHKHDVRCAFFEVYDSFTRKKKRRRFESLFKPE